MDHSGLLVGSCVFLGFSLDSMFPLHWVPLGQVRFYHNFGMDPGGLLVGSCVFLRFQLDSMFAFQWALLGQVPFSFSFRVGSSWAMFFKGSNLIPYFLSGTRLEPYLARICNLDVSGI